MARLLRTGIGVGAAALVLAVMPSIAFASTNLVSNGDFESGDAGWTGFGGDIQVVQGSSFVACCDVVGSPAALANHVAYFGSIVRVVPDEITQTTASVPGAQYSLRYDVAALADRGSSPVHGNRITVQIFDAVTDTYFTSGISGGDLFITDLDTGPLRTGLDFIAPSSLIELRFSLTRFPEEPAVDIQRDTAMFLDNVSLVQTAPPLPSSVPEPATWTLMITGFAGVGAALRRRHLRFAAVRPALVPRGRQGFERF